MKDIIKLLVAFFAFISFFFLPTSIKPALSSYQSYKNIEKYNKIKVKIDSSNFENFANNRKGYFEIFYANGEKKFRLNDYENHLLVTFNEKQKFPHFLNSERDSMYLWVNENAKTIYGLPHEKTLNKSLLFKEFLIDLSKIIVSLFFILSLVIIIKKNSKKAKNNNVRNNKKNGIEIILNKNENILWSGKPLKKAYYCSEILTGILFMLIGIIQFIIMYNFFIGWSDIPENSFSLTSIIVIAVMCIPFWAGIFLPISIISNYKNIEYVYTDKRVIIKRGLWGGIDYKSIEYDKITDIEINVGFIGQKFGTGNLHIVTGNNNGKNLVERMKAIENPYKVFKNINKVMLDIKSDISYPNGLRPFENKGYKTKYNPKR